MSAVSRRPPNSRTILRQGCSVPEADTLGTSNRAISWHAVHFSHFTTSLTVGEPGTCATAGSSPEKRKAEVFFDSSVFEASKKEGNNNLKRFLREGLSNTSVTCILSGTRTWTRRWVRYEIARSITKGNGLLTVDIHGVRNSDQNTSEKGSNPLDAMGLYKTEKGVFLAEWSSGKWVRYTDYTLAIPEKDLWFDPPRTTTVVPLSKHCMRYDFTAQDGRKNLGGWIEVAAGLAGR